jgi:hypothetical protein
MGSGITALSLVLLYDSDRSPISLEKNEEYFCPVGAIPYTAEDLFERFARFLNLGFYSSFI